MSIGLHCVGGIRGEPTFVWFLEDRRVEHKGCAAMWTNTSIVLVGCADHQAREIAGPQQSLRLIFGQRTTALDKSAEKLAVTP